jgi:hypothetical protein
LGRRSVRVTSIRSWCSRGKSPLRDNHLRVGENAKLSAGVEGKNPQATAQQNVTPIPTQRCRRASRVRAASSISPSGYTTSPSTSSSLSTPLISRQRFSQHEALYCTFSLIHHQSTIHQPSIVIIDIHHLPSTSIVFHIH